MAAAAHPMPASDIERLLTIARRHRIMPGSYKRVRGVRSESALPGLAGVDGHAAVGPRSAPVSVDIHSDPANGEQVSSRHLNQRADIDISESSNGIYALGGENWAGFADAGTSQYSRHISANPING
ncbi:hypothetical protein MDUV_20620 [Mycolicibacterium duvalii]|uniref:Uncharacterized protein n=1 Tax=Mycolicibacterium duvalii TaxID=39688 RepID=A0A7I7K1H4_9MYCO|nr:hypothetical protein MDUV_20620 [Mycolicibacterium duvalii]